MGFNSGFKGLKNVFFKREEILSYSKTQLQTKETTLVLSRHCWLNICTSACRKIQLPQQPVMFLSEATRVKQLVV